MYITFLIFKGCTLDFQAAKQEMPFLVAEKGDPIQEKKIIIIKNKKQKKKRETPFNKNAKLDFCTKNLAKAYPI